MQVLYINILKSSICNSQKLETTQIPVSRRMNKQVAIKWHVDHYSVVKRKHLLLHTTTRVNLKMSCWVKKSNLKDAHAVLFYLYKNLENTNTCNDRQHRRGGLRRIGIKKQQRFHRGTRKLGEARIYVHHLDCGLTDVHMCQNWLAVHFKCTEFIIWLLCLNKGY